MYETSILRRGMLLGSGLLALVGCALPENNDLNEADRVVLCAAEQITTPTTYERVHSALVACGLNNMTDGSYSENELINYTLALADPQDYDI